jgi:hypothetical protein
MAFATRISKDTHSGRLRVRWMVPVRLVLAEMRHLRWPIFTLLLPRQAQIDDIRTRYVNLNSGTSIDSLNKMNDVMLTSLYKTNGHQDIEAFFSRIKIRTNNPIGWKFLTLVANATMCVLPPFVLIGPKARHHALAPTPTTQPTGQCK